MDGTNWLAKHNGRTNSTCTICILIFAVSSIVSSSQRECTVTHDKSKHNDSFRWQSALKLFQSFTNLAHVDAFPQIHIRRWRLPERYLETATELTFIHIHCMNKQNNEFFNVFSPELFFFYLFFIESARTANCAIIVVVVVVGILQEIASRD